jgi:RNA polymerase sigma factor (sigma-70 family)
MLENKEFHISVNGRLVSVTEEIYLVYYRGERRMRYYERDIKTGKAIYDEDKTFIGYKPAKEDSLERMAELGEDYEDDCESVEDAILRALDSDELHEVLGQLPDSDRELIDALFFSNSGDGMTERECAAMFGISKTALHARKEKVFGKLRKLLKNNFKNS